jgi:membrane-associated phospholipid phosphatase
MWPRLARAWRPALILYPLLMQFSLTYAGEHYVADGIAGALCAALVHRLATSVERRIALERLGSNPGGQPEYENVAA